MSNRLRKYLGLLERADLHLHTSYTDGRNTVGEMARRAASNGLGLIAFTEHVRRKLDYDFGAFRKDVLAARRSAPGMRILCGAEAKVLGADGALDISKDVRGKCDVVVGVFHSFAGTGKVGYLAAVEGMLKGGIADIWGHPLLWARKNGLAISEKDWLRILRVAVENDVMIEFNERYGLPDRRFREMAIAAGCLHVRSSDAHSVGEILRPAAAPQSLPA